MLSFVLKMDTGAPVRIKPVGVEVRNVRCSRRGNYGHQSGDQECPLKDVIMPNEESRLKRDDPLTTIMAQTDSIEVRITFCSLLNRLLVAIYTSHTEKMEICIP
jgi:hypothetical protein